MLVIIHHSHKKDIFVNLPDQSDYHVIDQVYFIYYIQYMSNSGGIFD